MSNLKPKYEPPQIVPMGELAEAVGEYCVGGKGANQGCVSGDDGRVPASG
jgi:hypothetical protein